MATKTVSEEPRAVKLQETIVFDEDEIFYLRPPTVPESAVPIYDDDLHAVIGYKSSGSVSTIFDIDGNIVGMEEPGLESPLIDPIDLIFFGGGIFKALIRGSAEVAAETSVKVAALTGVRLSARRLAITLFTSLRGAFRQVPVRALQFTETAAEHMATKGRRVPIHILHRAIKFGTREVDPAKVPGAFRYTVQLVRNSKKYTLEVVVREKDWLILHFKYFN